MSTTQSEAGNQATAANNKGSFRPMNAINHSSTAKVSMRLARAGRVLLTAMAGAAILAACATTSGGGSSVADRAEQRWAAVIAGDYETAYGYYSPGFRSSRSLGDFELSQRLRKIQIQEVELMEQECEGDSCTLKFRATYRAASPVPGIKVFEGKSFVDEKWVRTQGQWWYLSDD